jgi:hypothetical protein
MVKIQICQFPELSVVAIGAGLGTVEIGAELSAKIHGAELMPHPRHGGSHINDTQKMTLAPRRVSSAPIITAPRSGSIF